MLKEMHEQAENHAKIQPILVEKDSLYSRIADHVWADEESHKKIKELENNSPAGISKLEAKKAELIRRLDEAEGNIASFQESAKKVESAYLDAMAKLRSEKIEAVKEKCHDLTMANTRFQNDLDEQIQNVTDLSREVRDMSDQLDKANFDSFCNCIKQLQSTNPGVTFNLKGIAPFFAFNEDGVLVNIFTNRAVNLEDPDLAVFDPGQPYAPLPSDNEASRNAEG